MVKFARVKLYSYCIKFANNSGFKVLFKNIALLLFIEVRKQSGQCMQQKALVCCKVLSVLNFS